MIAADRASWQNPKVLTILLAVFVTGAFAGALSMRLGLHERMHHSAPTLNSPANARVFFDRCQKELKLTPQQSNQMATILDDYKMYYQSLQDQLEEVRATGKSRIMAILNDEQKAKFEKVLSEMK
jgi:Spy/CpxP family protein refolding chaperone